MMPLKIFCFREKIITGNDTKKINRDKRTQVISFLTAEESERIGMNTKLYSYNAQRRQ